ncbi:MAG: orotidine 5'-phosphate decarboxylase [Planctomycetota bacterium]|nr:orotidine 5'-phosphate decarboxylase [Planctomycetota bacterium]
MLRLPEHPVVQLALDAVNLEPALRVAREAVPAGIALVEAGTPLIKSVGLEAVRRLRAEFPERLIVADMKTMDAGRLEVEYAAKAGADLVMVLGQATDATIEECVRAARHHGVAVGCDLVACPDPVARARQSEALGVDLLSVHVPIDQQMLGLEPFAVLAEVAAAVSLPVACAGGLTAASVGRAVAAGARICIVGGAIAKAADARRAAEEVLAALQGAAPSAPARQRLGRERIREVLARVSTPNLSDAMHRGGALRGLVNRNPGIRFAGPARTVIAAPGDWSKPVQAIDRCQSGEVLVIDAADRPPALWGGLASLTAVQRQLAGVVIWGACRDLSDIRRCGLALWSSQCCPDAGEPHGVGAFDLPVSIGGQTIQPGDWLVGDDDGLVRIPAADLVAVANRAADIAEREERLAAEIQRGRSLAEIAELARWERG